MWCHWSNSGASSRSWNFLSRTNWVLEVGGESSGDGGDSGQGEGFSWWESPEKITSWWKRMQTNPAKAEAFFQRFCGGFRVARCMRASRPWKLNSFSRRHGEEKYGAAWHEAPTGRYAFPHILYILISFKKTQRHTVLAPRLLHSSMFQYHALIRSILTSLKALMAQTFHTFCNLSDCRMKPSMKKWSHDLVWKSLWKTVRWCEIG